MKLWLINIITLLLIGQAHAGSGSGGGDAVASQIGAICFNTGMELKAISSKEIQSRLNKSHPELIFEIEDFISKVTQTEIDMDPTVTLRSTGEEKGCAFDPFKIACDEEQFNSWPLLRKVKMSIHECLGAQGKEASNTFGLSSALMRILIEFNVNFNNLAEIESFKSQSALTLLESYVGDNEGLSLEEINETCSQLESNYRGEFATFKCVKVHNSTITKIDEITKLKTGYQFMGYKEEIDQNFKAGLGFLVGLYAKKGTTSNKIPVIKEIKIPYTSYKREDIHYYGFKFYGLGKIYNEAHVYTKSSHYQLYYKTPEYALSECPLYLGLIKNEHLVGTECSSKVEKETEGYVWVITTKNPLNK